MRSAARGAPSAVACKFCKCEGLGLKGLSKYGFTRLVKIVQEGPHYCNDPIPKLRNCIRKRVLHDQNVRPLDIRGWRMARIGSAEES
eukprot:scaffold113656_cov51-Phaeocystis_antarctica.AAC.1